MAQILSSAVAIPEDAIDRPPSANGLKRRQSDASEQETKRQRTSSGKNSPTPTEEKPVPPQENGQDTNSNTEGHTKPPNADDTPPANELRKRSGGPDEKQRSKRLFGALLGNLNRPSDRTSKRRAEIEQRRKAELQKQDDERIEDRQRRLERLATQRKREQIRVDEENMHIRHRNLLDAANCLQTEAEPRLYYRPWDLLPDEEDRIDEQLKETQDRIDKEVAEFEEEKQKRLQEFERSDDDEATHESTKEDSVAAGIGKEKPTDVVEREMQSGDTDEQTANDSSVVQSSLKPSEVPESSDTPVNCEKPADEALREETVREGAEGKDKEEEKVEAEEDGDHVVEGDEDTVVY